MRTAQPLFTPDRPLRRNRRLPLLLLTMTALVLLPVASPAATQTNTDPSTKAAPHKPTSRAHKLAKPAATAAAAATRPTPVVQAPPKPDWPVNSKPTPAAILWNASGLRIDAANSSLQQILKEVSTLTGATVEGLGVDERVFGVYGPGTARDVLARLFDGSGYNMLLIGDQGQGTPRQILLTQRNSKAGAKQAAGSADDDTDDVEPDEQPQEPQQPQPPQPPQPPQIRNFGQQGQGNGQRTPQQMMQEMQQRRSQQ